MTLLKFRCSVVDSGLHTGTHRYTHATYTHTHHIHTHPSLPTKQLLSSLTQNPTPPNFSYLQATEGWQEDLECTAGRSADTAWTVTTPAVNPLTHLLKDPWQVGPDVPHKPLLASGTVDAILIQQILTGS